MVDEEGEEDTEEEEGAAGGDGDHHRDRQENPSFSPIRSGVDGIPGTLQSHAHFSFARNQSMREKSSESLLKNQE